MSDDIIKLSNIPIVDEWGAVHPQSVSAIDNITDVVKRQKVADHETGKYKMETTYDCLCYSISYYVSPATQMRGYSIKPLTYIGDDGNVESIFEVDTEEPRYKAILDSNDPKKEEKVISMHFREFGSKYNEL